MNTAAKARTADCYVFCLYPEKVRALCDMSNIMRWHFYVLGTNRIDENFRNQKSVRLKRLSSVTDPVGYLELKKSVDSCLGLG